MQRVPANSPWVIRQYLLGHPALALTTAVVTLVSAAVEVAFPWLLQQGIDVATGESAAHSLTTIAVAMLAVATAIVITYASTLAGTAVMFGHASFALRRSVYTRLQRLPLAALEGLRSGSVAFRATNDVAHLETHLQELANGLLFHGVVTVAAAILMAHTSVTLTVIVVGMMVAVAWVGAHLGDRLPLYQRAAQMRSAQLAGLLQESIAGGATIRAFGAQAMDLQRLDHANLRVQNVDVGGGLLRATVTPLWHFAELLSVVAVLWYGGSLVMGHQITVGALLGFLAFQQLIADPISRFGQYFYHWQSCRGLARRIAVTLVTEADEGTGAAAVPDASQPLIVNRLSVRDQTSGKGRLNGVSLQIQAGERVALVGRNGSGKSTLLNTLCALQSLSSGDVMLGQVRLNNCDPVQWRQVFGLMAQDTLLFHGSLAFNLALAKPGASRAELAAAVAVAGGARLSDQIHDELHAVDVNGLALSGGERRVIGFARLALRNPQIALLDEPTIHLDGVALVDALVALRHFARGRTLIVATHDIEVVKLCDRLVVMEAGRVVADGPVQQLITSSPHCRELFSVHREPVSLVGDISTDAAAAA
jgi:ABC-type multidrug transport system fused ATPase/permease subunit